MHRLQIDTCLEFLDVEEVKKLRRGDQKVDIFFWDVASGCEGWQKQAGFNWSGGISI